MILIQICDVTLHLRARLLELGRHEWSIFRNRTVLLAIALSGLA
jgi:hypothetical protein